MNSPTAVTWYKRCGCGFFFLHPSVLSQNKTWAWTKTKAFTQSPRHAAENIPITAGTGSEIHGLIPGRQCPKASCYSQSRNVSAFNGIVNRNAFPTGSEKDWHCCSDCYAPNSRVSHINILVLSLTHLCVCVYLHTCPRLFSYIFLFYTSVTSSPWNNIPSV